LLCRAGGFGISVGFKNP